MRNLIFVLCAVFSCSSVSAQTVKQNSPMPRRASAPQVDGVDQETEKDRPLRTAVTHLRNAVSMKDRQKILKQLALANQYLHREESSKEEDYTFAILLLAAAFENAGKHRQAQSLYCEFEREVSKKGNKTPSELNQIIIEAAVWAPLAVQNESVGQILAQEAYRRARKLDDDYQIAKALSLLGSFDQEKHKHTAAMRYLYRALAIYTSKDDKFSDMQHIRRQLVELELEKDNYDAALRICNEMIESENKRKPDSADLVTYIEQLARVLDRCGEHERAKALYANWRERLKPRFSLYINFLTAFERYARDYADYKLAGDLNKEFLSLNKTRMAWSQARSALQAYANDLKRAGYESLWQQATKAELQLRSIHEQDQSAETTIATAFGPAPKPHLQSVVADPTPSKLRQAALKQSVNVANSLQRYQNELDRMGTENQKQQLKSVQDLLVQIKNEQEKPN